MKKNNSFPWVATPLAIAISGFAAGNAEAVGLDTSFGSSGLASLNIQPGAFYPVGDKEVFPAPLKNTLLEKSDGELVSFASRYEEVGTYSPGYCIYYTPWGVACYSGYWVAADGNIQQSDSSRMARFNAGGTPLTQVSLDGIIVYAAHEQTDGKLVVAGNHFARAGGAWSNTKPVQTVQTQVRRFNADGSVDNSFGGDGIAPIGAGGINRLVKDVVQLNNGQLLILTGAACEGKSSNGQASLFKLNMDGSLDASFGAAGEFSLGAATCRNEMIRTVNDNILILSNNSAGVVQIESRLSTTAALDTTFDSDGVLNPVGLTNAYSIRASAGGKIIVGGNVANKGLTMLRYNSDGSLDATFAIAGPVEQPWGFADISQYTSSGYQLGLKQNGDVIIYNSDGTRNSLTHTLFTNGLTSDLLGQSNSRLLVSGVDGSGNAMLAGYSSFGNNDSDGDGIAMNVDNCPMLYTINQHDLDGDGIGDLCDPDTDEDGVINATDKDDDNDGVLDVSDNCLFVVNADQLNTDGDTQGDVCDATPNIADSAIGVTVGYSHTCILTTVGSVKCWGSNGYGQLGDNTTIDRLTPVDVVGLSSGVSAISAAEHHTCALMATGGVKCWGSNQFGQLGDNTTIDRLTPVDVVGLSSSVSAISAGSRQTCALLATGGAKCWGSNEFGQLGDGTTIDRHAPVNVKGVGGVSILSGVTEIAVSSRFDRVCARTSTSAVVCWGYWDYIYIPGSGHEYFFDSVPYHILSNGAISTTAHCAVMTTGNMKCWSGNYNASPIVTDVVGVGGVGLLGGVIASATGDTHSCALINTGSVDCWGSNYYGQLGNNTTVPSSTPVYVLGTGGVSLLSGITAISASNHTCALTNTGGVMCWGNGTLIPVFVVGLSGDTDEDGIADSVDADDDNDGMPDIWETTYGLNPLVNDANGDLDGDGFTNKTEFDNGTDPAVVNDIFKVKNDYNNDGIANWYWKGDSSGNETKNEIWQLTFPLQSSGWGVPTRSYPSNFVDQPNWEIVTSGDFNKDGDADVLWRNKSTAQWRVWQIQNGTRSAQNDLADFDLAHEWQVIGAGDTDNDGDDDVILNNATTGEVRVWQMQDHAIGNTHSIGTKAGYTLNRIGDFNKDGDVDLLFRQNAGDALVTWEITNNTFVAERSLGNTGSGFSPACAGDFDNDGDDDIMLLNSTTTQEKWIVMENYARSQRFGSANSGFYFVACGDYDGDGDTDTLWQRTSDAKTRVVLQQNVLTTAAKQTVYTNPYGAINGFVYRGNRN